MSDAEMKVAQILGRKVVRRKSRSKVTMKGTFHGSLDNPHWVHGRRVIYLDCPYADREAAKAAGAKWNPDRHAWWILADVDRAPFAKWMPLSERPEWREAMRRQEAERVKR